MQVRTRKDDPVHRDDLQGDSKPDMSDTGVMFTSRS